MAPDKDRKTDNAASAGFWRLQKNGLSALLARNDLTWESARVYLALAYLTVGYRKDRDVVSLGQIAELAHTNRPHTVRALHRLAELGLYGQETVSAHKMIRRVTYPAPCAPGDNNSGVAEAGNSTTIAPGVADVGNRGVAEAGNTMVGTPGVPEAGNRGVPEVGNIGVPEAGTLPDTENREDSLRGETPPGKLFGDEPKPPAQTPSTYEAMKLWCQGWKAHYGEDLTNRGKVAGVLRRLVRAHGAEKVGQFIGSWLGADRDDHGIELFEVRVNGRNGELWGRKNNRPTRHFIPKPSGESVATAL